MFRRQKKISRDGANAVSSAQVACTEFDEQNIMSAMRTRVPCQHTGICLLVNDRPNNTSSLGHYDGY